MEKVRNKSILFTFQNLLDTFNILANSHAFYHCVLRLTLTWFNLATTDIQLIYNMLKNNLSFLRASWKLNFQLYLLPIDLRDWQLYDFGDISKFASISSLETVLCRLTNFCMKSIGVCVCLFPIGMQLDVQSFCQFHSWARISHKLFSSVRRATKSTVNLVKTSLHIVYVHDFELQFSGIIYNFLLFAILHTFYHFIFLRDKKSHFISCTKYSISQLSIKFIRFLFYVLKI